MYRLNVRISKKINKKLDSIAKSSNFENHQNLPNRWFGPPKKTNSRFIKKASKCSTALRKVWILEFMNFTKFLAPRPQKRAVRAHRADIPRVYDFFFELKISLSDLSAKLLYRLYSSYIYVIYDEAKYKIFEMNEKRNIWRDKVKTIFYDTLDINALW